MLLIKLTFTNFQVTSEYDKNSLNDVRNGLLEKCMKKNCIL